MDNEGNAAEVAINSYMDTQGETTSETESAPVEQSTESELETSEKTEISQEPQEESEESQQIPYERFSQKVQEANELKARVAELEQKAQLLDALQNDPSIASAFLKNVPKAQEVNPVMEEARAKLQELGVPVGLNEDKIKEIVHSVVQEANRATAWEQDVDRQASDLEKKYDGKNGLPAFDPEQLVDFVKKTGGVRREDGGLDLEGTFFYMNKEAFIDAKAKEKRSTAYSEKPGKVSGMPTEASEWEASLKEAKETKNFENVLEQFLPDWAKK